MAWIVRSRAVTPIRYTCRSHPETTPNDTKRNAANATLCDAMVVWSGCRSNSQTLARCSAVSRQNGSRREPNETKRTALPETRNGQRLTNQHKPNRTKTNK
eukprot:jgi/Psemu1/311406/fgenesh1_kg.765_\